MELHGFLNIDKAEAWTSHDVVAKLRRLLKPYGLSKIGHAGTLDPFATGVLPIALGASTRLIRFLPKTKRYMAELNFSYLTDTDDLSGEALEHNPDVLWTRETLDQTVQAMIGSLEQMPPLYSARKYKGKRLYELMRSEIDFDVDQIKTKTVEIYNANLLDFNYPLAVIDFTCSEGTYIRSIARDLGGHLSKLRRLESNKFKIDKSVSLEQLESHLDSAADLEEFIIDSARVLDLPVLEFDNKEVIFLQQGREVPVTSKLENVVSQDVYFKCLDSNSELIALGLLQSRRGDLVLQPKVVL